MTTIKDISERAGVSPGTVSRALSADKSAYVAEETRKRIQDVANQLGYHFANRAKDAATLNIVIITTLTLAEETRDEYWRFIRKGMFEAARHEHITIKHVIRLQNELNPADLKAHDAVLVVGAISESAVNEIQAINPNLVIIDGGRNYHNQVDTVETNLGELTQMALDQMAAATTGQIAFIGGARSELNLDGRLNQLIVDPRVAAYQKWVTTNHKPNLYQEIDWTTESAMHATEALIEQVGKHLSGILVASDPFAIGVMRGLSKKHLIPGKDVALMSFDDLEFAPFLTPSLSSIWIPKAELGYEAILHAETLTKVKRTWPVQTIIPGKMKYRETFNPKISG